MYTGSHIFGPWVKYTGAVTLRGYGDLIARAVADWAGGRIPVATDSRSARDPIDEIGVFCRGVLVFDMAL